MLNRVADKKNLHIVFEPNCCVDAARVIDAKTGLVESKLGKSIYVNQDRISYIEIEK